jgi:hypothetical protein
MVVKNLSLIGGWLGIELELGGVFKNTGSTLKRRYHAGFYLGNLDRNHDCKTGHELEVFDHEHEGSVS